MKPRLALHTWAQVIFSAATTCIAPGKCHHCTPNGISSQSSLSSSSPPALSSLSLLNITSRASHILSMHTLSLCIISVRQSFSRKWQCVLLKKKVWASFSEIYLRICFLGARKMALKLRALAILPENLGQFPVPTWRNMLSFWSTCFFSQTVSSCQQC